MNWASNADFISLSEKKSDNGMLHDGLTSSFGKDKTSTLEKRTSPLKQWDNENDLVDLDDNKCETLLGLNSLTVRDKIAEPETNSSAPKSEQNQKGWSVPNEGEEVGSGGLDRTPDHHVVPEMAKEETALGGAGRHDQPQEASKMSVPGGTDVTDCPTGIQGQLQKDEPWMSSYSDQSDGLETHSVHGDPGSADLCRTHLWKDLSKPIGRCDGKDFRVSIRGTSRDGYLGMTRDKGEERQVDGTSNQKTFGSNQLKHDHGHTKRPTLPKNGMDQRSTGWNLLAWIKKKPGKWLTWMVFLGILMVGKGAHIQKIQLSKTVSTAFYNVTSDIKEMEATMEGKNLTEMDTEFTQCDLDGFYNLGQDTMFSEYLSKVHRRPEQLCASIDPYNIHNIDDHECTTKLKFVCRVNDTACSGDLEYNGSTYRLINETKSWFDAAYYCYENQGILAVPDFVNETFELITKLLEHFKMHLKERFWIGLRKLDFCYNGTPAIGIKWQDGEPNYKLRCVALIKDNVTGDVKARTINCSSMDTFTTPGWTNSTIPPVPGNDTITPPTPGKPNPGKTAGITFGVLLIVSLIISAVICCFKRESIKQLCSKETKEFGQGGGENIPMMPDQSLNKEEDGDKATKVANGAV